MPVKGIWSKVILSLWPSGAGSWIDIGEVMLMVTLWSVVTYGAI